MWPKLLHKYFPRVFNNRASFAHRHRWLVERLEHRLLLSADALPTDTVLHILGTEGDDTALVRTLESETPGAAQLIVVLNGASFAHTIETGQAIHIDLLGGEDTLNAQITVDADWTMELGDGNDRTHVDVRIGDRSADAHYHLHAGEGDNETVIQFGDGEHGRLPPVDQTRIIAEYRSGAGNDRLTIDWQVHLDRPLEFDVSAITGAGLDDNIARWEHSYEFRTGKAPQVDYEFDTGPGDDTLTLDFLGDLGAIGVKADVGAGNDTVRLGAFSNVEPGASPSELLLNAHVKSIGVLSVLTLFPMGTLEMSQAIDDDRAGHSSANLDLVLNGSNLTVDIQTGAADDSLKITPALQTPRAAMLIHFDGGAGADAISVDTSHLVVPVLGSFSEVSGLDSENQAVEYREGMEIGENLTLQIDMADLESLRIKTGNGEDKMRVDVDNPRRRAPELAFYTGDGNDAVEASFVGVQGGIVFKLDTGIGDDHVLIDFAALERERGKDSSIVMDLRGGAGDDGLVVKGTDVDDRFTLTENIVMLEGVAAIGYSRFEALCVKALAGDDTVTMTGIHPLTRTTLDGGVGRDRFIGRFDSDVVGNLTLVNFEQTTMQGRGRFLGTLTNLPG